jgi:hypothetical protein
MLTVSKMTAIKTMAVATPIDTPVVTDHQPTPPLSHMMTTHPNLILLTAQTSTTNKFKQPILLLFI